MTDLRTDLIAPEVEASAPAPTVRTAMPIVPATTKETLGPPRVETNANINNLLNVLGYLLSLISSYLGGVAGWFGGISNTELNSKYQTLITPSAAYVGYIWAVIFIFEGFFAVSQLLPRFREQPLVQRGIGSFYFLACSAQTAWAITFGYEFMIAAFVAIFALCVALLAILNRQWQVVTDEEMKAKTAMALCDTSMEEEMVEDLTAPPPRLPYWLLRFPFAVHAGWTAPAIPLMLSVLLVEKAVDPQYELWVAVISIPLLFGLCMGLLMREDAGAPAYSFTGVVAYACAGIWWELQAPTYSILERHDEASINLMKNLSWFCGGCLGVVMISRFIALFVRDQCMKLKKEDTVEIDGEEYVYVQA